MGKIKGKKIALWVFCVAITVGSGWAVLMTKNLNEEIRSRFDGNKWDLPAIVYARPLELYIGRKLTPLSLKEELLMGGYREEKEVMSSGGFIHSKNRISLTTRDFVYPSGIEESKNMSVHFNDAGVMKIRDETSGADLNYVRIDPVRIGSFHPLIHEDRVVLTKDQIPDLLIESLVAVEDRNFYHHHGISLKGIARALMSNIRAGRTVQGGSTLTQQLVKNFFLGRERTISRKIKEAAMAILLEFNYSKEQILTAYINEVFLGQDGARAVHGFGLASQFYFRRELGDLSAAQVATLVGMIKGPSLYDPRRNKEKTFLRRKTVLNILLAESVIDSQTCKKALLEPLIDVKSYKAGVRRFPAFLDLVKRELIKVYREEDLGKSGLKILTTLDPQVQLESESGVKEMLGKLPEGVSDSEIEAAVVVTGRETGEIQALIGGKNFSYVGFNRALDANRSIGSLVKPAVYLTALERGYSLADPLDDTAVMLENDGKAWRPQNYDRQEHGRVALYSALARSYNLATVNLGMHLGLESVIETLRKLGFSGEIERYPSLLLGAVSMSPLEVAQCYQTIASGGFHLPLRSIQAVMANDGELLNRYGIRIEQRFAPESVFLLNHGLQRVMEEGSGRGMAEQSKLLSAGKTGTTDGMRDSWFAGYTGDRLAVIWLGNDQNLPINLTGSRGAMQLWRGIMNNLDARPLNMPEPPGIAWRRIDRKTLKNTTLFNRNSTFLPFATGRKE